MSSHQYLQQNGPPMFARYGSTIPDPDEKIAAPNGGYAEHFENGTSRAGGASPKSKNREDSGATVVDEDEAPHDTSGNKTQETKSPDEELEEHERRISHLREHMGLAEDPQIDPEHESASRFSWPMIRVMFREPFAEFFGTMIMVMFGNGAVAQALLGGGEIAAPGGNGYGNYQSVNWGWAVGIFFGIYIAGDSGGFLNPAVTLAFCVFRKLPWRRFPIYFLAQFLGGFVGSGIVYANYIDSIDKYEGGHGIRTVTPSRTATAGIFCTYPQVFLTKSSQFVSEFVASTILMFCIFALQDNSNPGAMGKSGAGALFPLGLLFLLVGLGGSFGWDTGYAINFARDFGPRLMSYILGYGPGVWSAGGYYFWIPIVAPFCGCIFGGFLYDAFIYTGPETPMNKQWLGFKELYDKRNQLKKTEKLNRQKDEV